MKEVISINIQGRIIPIEVVAFDSLRMYMDTLQRFFAQEEGKDEIINDIENRIAELFQQKLSAGKVCINESDLQEIIASIGEPEDFDQGATTENKTEPKPSDSVEFAPPTKLFRDERKKIFGGVCAGLAAYFKIDVIIIRLITVLLIGFLFLPYIILWLLLPGSSSLQIGSRRKKLYRDREGDGILAGVCSGLGHYFGISPWIPRILFLLPLLNTLFSAVSDDVWLFHIPSLIKFSISPTSLLVYIILWLVTDEAKTTSEKLEMKGESVDMNTIYQSVRDEMKSTKQSVAHTVTNVTEKISESGQKISGEMGGAGKRALQILGRLVLLMIKIFGYFLLFCIVGSLLLTLFVIGISGLAVFPLRYIIIETSTENYLAWASLFLFFLTPIVASVVWFIRRIGKIKKNGKTISLAFAGAWIIGIFCFLSLIISVARHFRSESPVLKKEMMTFYSPAKSMNIKLINDWGPSEDNFGFQISANDLLFGDTLRYEGAGVKIVPSKNDSFCISVVYSSRGDNRVDAERYARSIGVDVAQMDSTITVNKQIHISSKDKFRVQKAVVVIMVPEGKQIIFSSNDPDEYDDGDTDYDFEDVDMSKNKNNSSVREYIMRKDGLYTPEGKKSKPVFFD